MSSMAQVLVIEPDKALGRTYVRSLTARGHAAQSVQHAQDAVLSADTAKPDIIVLELQLGAHNGLEFLYEFRSYAEWASIPVVLLTMVSPHSLMITPDMMSRLGIYRCLYKPATTLVQLGRTVDDCVKGLTRAQPA